VAERVLRGGQGDGVGPLAPGLAALSPGGASGTGLEFVGQVVHVEPKVFHLGAKLQEGKVVGVARYQAPSGQGENPSPDEGSNHRKS